MNLPSPDLVMKRAYKEFSVAPSGFEPESSDPESDRIDRYPTGLSGVRNKLDEYLFFTISKSLLSNNL